MSKRKYLFRRSGGSYNLVMKIPADLQPILNAKWIKRSLKTSNLKDADILLNSIVGKIQSSFSLLRTGALNDDQVMAIKASILPCRRTLSINPTLTIHELIYLYIQEKAPNWTIATKSSFEQKFQCMKNNLSSVIVRHYTREDFLEYRNKLISMGLQPKTINVRISLLSSLLKWGVRHGYLTHNHAEGLQLKLDKAPDEQRKAYEQDDLKRIVENLPISSRCPWQFWIPMIAMYSGMRREEICQLRGCDFIQFNDVWCFRIIADSQAGLKVKTESSSRIVPLHPKLLAYGIVEYISSNKSDSNLWGFKRYNCTGEYGKKFGNWYSKFNREYVTDDPLKCFHSFRHTVANILKQAGEQELVIAELLGHKNNSLTTGRYGKKYEINQLYIAVLKLTLISKMPIAQNLEQ